jgi:tetratricopeptide (TPR) repeat protein
MSCLSATVRAAADTADKEAAMNETFGEALRRLRGTRSVRDVARLAQCGKTLVSDLETGRRKPTPPIAAALDKALDAKGELIDLAAAPPGTPALERAAVLQRGMTDTLSAGPMTDAGLEEWRFTVSRHGRATRYRPALEHLDELTADFADLQRLIKHRHPPPVRRQLTVAAAHMSGLVALTLLKLGDPGSRDWWRTGRAAAAASEDRAAMSWMYAHEAYELYYAGNIEGAVELASRAQHLAGGLPCVGPALAAPLEARAHAVQGRRDEAAGALERAQVALDRLPTEERIPSAFGYSESQFRFHAGNAWTHLARTSQAKEQHARALELYPEFDQTDRALVHLDQAACLALDGQPAAAAAHAAETIIRLPADQRSTFIAYRAGQLIATVPDSERALPEVRSLSEMLALPPGGRDSQHGDDRQGDGGGR